MNPNMFAKVILASRPTNGAPPIITMHWRYPRIIHGEVMTHRKKSKNARSSRAVPVMTMLNEVRNDPFVPWHWGKNQKGMQAAEECNERINVRAFLGFNHDMYVSREEAWLTVRDKSADAAEAYMTAGYHKQIANRLLEPFSWIDTLVTSTSWANFLHLRDHEDAEPHFQDLARLVRAAIEGADYQELVPGEWHLPYITEDDHRAVSDHLRPGRVLRSLPLYVERIPLLQKISAARCARISYAPFDGNPSIEREIERFNHLVGSSRIHASPTEHQATPDEGITNGQSVHWMHPELAGNLGPGWIQFRKTLPGEFIAD